MKKFLCLLLVVLMLGSVALSEAYDVTSLSDSELIELRHAIDSELNSRLPSMEKPIYGGIYTVGKDIAAGSYNIRFVGDSHQIGDLYLFSGKEDFDNNNAMQVMSIRSQSRGLFVVLTDGMLLGLDYSEEAYISSADTIE